MTNVFENRLSMYQKVNGYLALHAAETSSIAAIATLKTQLDANINAILLLASVADADVTGTTVDKQNKRNAAKTALLKVSTACVAHASMNNLIKLKEKCDLTPSSIDYLRDNDFYAYCKTVSTEANAVGAALAPFGVLPANIAALDTAANAFFANIQDPRLQINEASKARIDYEIKFQETSDLINLKLDNVMTVFISSNPSLYNGYQGARSIDDTGAQSDPDYAGDIAPAATALIVKLPYLASRTFTFKNIGTVPLIFSLEEDGGTTAGIPITVSPGGSAQRSTKNLNNNLHAEDLQVRNADAGISGSYEVRITE
jgi:hypothetical protein